MNPADARRCLAAALQQPSCGSVPLRRSWLTLARALRARKFESRVLLAEGRRSQSNGTNTIAEPQARGLPDRRHSDSA